MAKTQDPRLKGFEVDSCDCDPDSAPRLMQMSMGGFSVFHVECSVCRKAGEGNLMSETKEDAVACWNAWDRNRHPDGMVRFLTEKSFVNPKNGS